MMILGFKKWWELAPHLFCTPLQCRKTHAKAFFDRNTQKKMSFFMSRRDALYTFEEIAPNCQHPMLLENFDFQTI